MLPAAAPTAPAAPPFAGAIAVGQSYGAVLSGIIPDADTRFYFVGIDKARFRRPVEPGDQLLLNAQFERSFKGIWRFSTVALVGENEVAHADVMVTPDAGK